MAVREIDLGIIFLYLVVTLYLGYRGYRKSGSAEDYLLAGRRLGYPMYIGCLAAVVLGGASTVGGASLGYQYGISGFWMVFMIGAGIVGLGLLLTSKLSNLRVLSISEMLELRFDRGARLVSAAIMTAYATFIAVIQVIAIGTILEAMLGWSSSAGMLAGGLVVIVYTFLGGMWSVSMTDFLQFLLMTVGIFFLMLPVGLTATGGLSGLASAVPGEFFEPDTIGYGRIGTYFLLFFLGLLIGQDIWQRVFTARDATVARRGTVLAGLYCILYAAATALIGIIAYSLTPGLEDPQMAFATVAVSILPAGVSGLVLAGSLSALMSTASGPLLAASTLIANDIYRPLWAPEISDEVFLRRARFITAVVGAAVIGFSLWIQDVIVALDIAYTLLSGSLFVPVFAGFFWKRANARGTWISMGSSALAAVVAMVHWGPGSNPPIVIGLVTSLVTLVVASLATAPPDEAKLATWESRLAG